MQAGLPLGLRMAPTDHGLGDFPLSQSKNTPGGTGLRSHAAPRDPAPGEVGLWAL